jgi:uncharacterized Tic20 family protein
VEFAKRCTFAERHKQADKVLVDLQLLVGSVRIWLEKKDSKTGLSQAQKEKLNKALEGHFKSFEEVC